MGEGGENISSHSTHMGGARASLGTRAGAERRTGIGQRGSTLQKPTTHAVLISGMPGALEHPIGDLLRVLASKIAAPLTVVEVPRWHSIRPLPLSHGCGLSVVCRGRGGMWVSKNLSATAPGRFLFSRPYPCLFRGVEEKGGQRQVLERLRRWRRRAGPAGEKHGSPRA
jgi:hypothetical protein